jgi:DegV family protein with EDD domain
MIKIVTDTAVSLPPDVIKRYDITLLAGYIQFGEERFVDHFELTHEQFYERLVSSSELPQSIDPTPDEFKVLYRSLLGQRPDASILSIHCTGQLATTAEAARIAAASFPGASIHVFDTLSLGGGQGLMVWEAAVMASNGATLQDILRRLSAMRSDVRRFFTLDTIDYLARSGRVGQFERLLGTLLDVKPVLTLADGRLQPYSQHRTRVRALEALRDMVVEAGQGKPRFRVGVVHANCPDDAKRLADELDFVLKPETMFVGMVSVGVGAVSGPGGLGVCWYAPIDGGDTT